MFRDSSLFLYKEIGGANITVADPVAGGGGGQEKKHEIYSATFGSHLIFTGWGVGPCLPPDQLLHKGCIN